MSDAKEAFDLESVYDDEIAPLMTQILAICKRERLPMFASFAYHFDHEDGHSFCTSHLNWPERDVRQFRAAENEVRNRHSFMAMTITHDAARGAK